jgi:hypothetical protein
LVFLVVVCWGGGGGGGGGGRPPPPDVTLLQFGSQLCNCQRNASQTSLIHVIFCASPVAELESRTIFKSSKGKPLPVCLIVITQHLSRLKRAVAILQLCLIPINYHASYLLFDEAWSCTAQFYSPLLFQHLHNLIPSGIWHSTGLTILCVTTPALLVSSRSLWLYTRCSIVIFTRLCPLFLCFFCRLFIHISDLEVCGKEKGSFYPK